MRFLRLNVNNLMAVRVYTVLRLILLAIYKIYKKYVLYIIIPSIVHLSNA